MTVLMCWSWQNGFATLLRLATANTSATCCCDHVRKNVAAHITYIKLPPYSMHESLCSRQPHTGGAGGDGGFLMRDAIATATTSQVFEC